MAAFTLFAQYAGRSRLPDERRSWHDDQWELHIGGVAGVCRPDDDYLNSIPVLDLACLLGPSHRWPPGQCRHHARRCRSADRPWTRVPMALIGVVVDKFGGKNSRASDPPARGRAIMEIRVRIARGDLWFLLRLAASLEGRFVAARFGHPKDEPSTPPNPISTKPSRRPRPGICALDAFERGGHSAYPNGIEPEPRKRRCGKMVLRTHRS
jgi:hypothetical protein